MKRKQHEGIIGTVELDAMIAEASFSYYFWNWDTIYDSKIPLLEVFIGSVIGEKHDAFRALLLERDVRVKYINHSDFKRH